MKVNNILGIINNLEYEPDVEEVIIPVKHLSILKKYIKAQEVEISQLKDKLHAEILANKILRSECFEVMAQQEPILTRFGIARLAILA